MKLFRVAFVLLISFIIAGPGTSPAGKPVLSFDKDQLFKAGNHYGEQDMLDVNIGFFGEYGQTVTDENGTTYHMFGMTFYENKVYPPEYWGVFPLYFFDSMTGVEVAVSNNGPAARKKLRVRTEVYCLKTDGGNGAEIATPQETDIIVAIGQTEVVDASFVTFFTPEAEGGLDRFLVKILHPNAGGKNGNDDPALIMSKEGIFCPPELEGEVLEQLDEVLNP